jgi:hypothetical protein
MDGPLAPDFFLYFKFNRQVKASYLLLLDDFWRKTFRFEEVMRCAGSHIRRVCRYRLHGSGYEHVEHGQVVSNFSGSQAFPFRRQCLPTAVYWRQYV